MIRSLLVFATLIALFGVLCLQGSSVVNSSTPRVVLQDGYLNINDSNGNIYTVNLQDVLRKSGQKAAGRRTSSFLDCEVFVHDTVDDCEFVTVCCHIGNCEVCITYFIDRLTHSGFIEVVICGKRFFFNL